MDISVIGKMKIKAALIPVLCVLALAACKSEERLAADPHGGAAASAAAQLIKLRHGAEADRALVDRAISGLGRLN